MLQINKELFCEQCFEKTDSYPCPRCKFNGVDEKRHAVALPKGTVLLEKYVIGKMLGKGGFGITYLAYDYKNKCRVAIKEYYPSGLVYRQPGETKLECSPNKEEIFKDGEERFYEEAKTIAKLNSNENIVTVYEFFKENNTSYFVMEYLEGCDLKGYVQNGALSEGQAVSVIKAVCNALGEAHEKDVLHRDISPDNIFICNDGRIMLIDFGAARQLAAEKSQSMSVILKQGFAPIEQYQRRSHHGPWSDVYALGATIYYALVRYVPDDAITRMASPELDFSKNPSVSDAFKNILSKMMAVNVSDRYSDTNEVMAGVNALGITPIPLVAVQQQAVHIPKEPEKAPQPQMQVQQTPKSESFEKKPENADKKALQTTEKKRPKGIFIIAAVMLVAVTIVTAMFLINNDPKEKTPIEEETSAPVSKVETDIATEEETKSFDSEKETDVSVTDEETTTQTPQDDTPKEDEIVLSGDGYILTTDGTLTITNDNAMNDYWMYSDTPWYSNNRSIKKIVIQNDVTRIGDFAFNDCDGLSSVTIPKSVTNIGNYAFFHCDTMASITIPNSVTGIGDYAFGECINLSSLTIPDSVTSIGEGAFDHCSRLAFVTIPNSVTSIGSDAFDGCYSLTSITIPDSVTSIGDKAFRYCDSLTAINVSSGNANYTSVDGVLFDKSKTTLIQYPSGKQGAYTIPNGVTSIGDGAFYECDNLTSITIPNGVTSIGKDAFLHCDSLVSVTIPNSVTSIGGRAFIYCDILQTINFEGTQAQWNAITKGSSWDVDTGDYTINYLG